MRERHEKLAYFDGLRGLAALAVLLFHFCMGFYPACIDTSIETIKHSGFEQYFLSTPLSVLLNGHFSVCLFFVLSGYVLTFKFFSSGNEAVLSSSAARRYLRLLPVIALSMVAGAVLLQLGLRQPIALYKGFADAWVQPAPYDLSPLRLIYDTLWGVLFKGEAPENIVLWTMRYEFFGSFLVLGCAALFGKLERRWVIYAVLAFALRKSYYLAFVIGMVLSDLSARRPELIGRFKHPLTALALLLGGLYFATIEKTGQDGLVYRLPELLGKPDLLGSRVTFFHTVAALLIMLLVLLSARAQGFFSSKPLLFLGRISFPMYAIHLMIIESASIALFLTLRRALSYDLAALLTFGATLALVFGLAALVDRFVDSPGIRFAARMQARFFGAKA